MDISLTPELEKYVESQVQSGHYETSSDVLIAGVQLLIDRDNHSLEELRKEIRIGLEQLNHGESRSAEDALAELMERRASRASLL